MNLQGFVPMRRALLDHTMDGTLSLHEFAAFSVLIFLADKQTGAGRINAPCLTFWLPDLSYDAAKRVLLSLEKKKYIYRAIPYHTKAAYQYWVNKYEITDGPHKSLQTNLSQVFISKDTRDIEYLKPAPHTAPHTAPETAPHTAPETALQYNTDKDKETDKENDNLPTCIGESRSISAHTETTGRGVSAHSAPGTAPHCADTAPHCRDTAETLPRSALAGLTLVLAPAEMLPMKWSGSEGAYVDAGDRRVLPPMEVDRRLKSVGLRRVQSEFFTIDDNTAVSWEDAQQRIAGVKEISA